MKSASQRRHGVSVCQPSGELCEPAIPWRTYNLPAICIAVVGDTWARVQGGEEARVAWNGRYLSWTGLVGPTDPVQPPREHSAPPRNAETSARLRRPAWSHSLSPERARSDHLASAACRSRDQRTRPAYRSPAPEVTCRSKVTGHRVTCRSPRHPPVTGPSEEPRRHRVVSVAGQRPASRTGARRR